MFLIIRLGCIGGVIMRLEMCVYISRTTKFFRQTDVPALAEASAQHNRTQEITGLLLQIGDYFVQVLEGDTLTLSALLTKISHDKRHTNIQVIYKNAMPARLFEQWNMGYFNIEQHYELSRLDLIDLRRTVTDAFNNQETAGKALVLVLRSIPALLEGTASPL
jgi:hypothetical protein